MENALRLGNTGGIGIAFHGMVSLASEDTVKKGLFRNRKGLIHTWQHEYDNKGQLWILYEGLPSETKGKVDAYYLANYGTDVYGAYRNGNLIAAAKSCEQLESDGLIFQKEKLYSTAQVGDLVKAAGWLRYLSGDEFWKSHDLGGKTRAYSYVAELIGGLNLYGFKISNGRSLERKVRDWTAMGLNCLISEKFGTKNAVKPLLNTTLLGGPDNGEFNLSKVDIQELALDRLIYLYGDPRNGSIQMVTNLYNCEAKVKGFPTYTCARVWQMLRACKIEWQASREGVNAVRAKREVIIKRKRAERPNVMWSLDGTTIQLLGIDENGKVAKVGYWVMVVDAATDCIIGYAFGKTETTNIVLKALRMAVSRANRLPDWLQYDGAKANLSSEVQDLIKGMEVKGLRAQPYNGKSKYVERIIGKVEQTFMRLMPNFVGGNITTKKQSSKGNIDFLNKQLKEDSYQNATTALEELRLIIETYNHTKVARLGMSPWRAYMKAEEQGRAINELMIVALFWVKNVGTNKYMQSGLTLTKNGVRREYVVETGTRGQESEEFRAKYLGCDFCVRYNPDDYTHIHLYDPVTDKYVAMAAEKYAFEAVPTEGQMGTQKQIWQGRKDAIDNSLKKYKARAATQMNLGNDAISFETVHKDAMNEAIAQMELDGLSVQHFPQREKAAKNDERVSILYDLGDVESGKVLTFD